MGIQQKMKIAFSFLVLAVTASHDDDDHDMDYRKIQGKCFHCHGPDIKDCHQAPKRKCRKSNQVKNNEPVKESRVPEYDCEEIEHNVDVCPIGRDWDIDNCPTEAYLCAIGESIGGKQWNGNSGCGCISRVLNKEDLE